MMRPLGQDMDKISIMLFFLQTYYLFSSFKVIFVTTVIASLVISFCNSVHSLPLSSQAVYKVHQLKNFLVVEHSSNLFDGIYACHLENSHNVQHLSGVVLFFKHWQSNQLLSFLEEEKSFIVIYCNVLIERNFECTFKTKIAFDTSQG